VKYTRAVNATALLSSSPGRFEPDRVTTEAVSSERSDRDAETLETEVCHKVSPCLDDATISDFVVSVSRFDAD